MLPKRHVEDAVNCNKSKSFRISGDLSLLVDAKAFFLLLLYV